MTADGAKDAYRIEAGSTITVTYKTTVDPVITITAKVIDGDGDSVESTFTLTLASDGTLTGGPGSDVLVGGSGNEAFVGGGGSDVINGGGGNDVAYFSGTSSNDTMTVVDSGVKTNVTVNGVTSTVSGVETIALSGGAGDDMLDGSGTAVKLILSGDAGNDTLKGGSGDDVLLGGDGNDTLIGNAGNDKLYGGAGNDTLDGGVGDDLLVGGAGSDTITGGSGSDVIEINLAESSTGSSRDVDTVKDFTDSDAIKVHDVLPDVDGFNYTETSVSGGTKVVIDSDGTSKTGVLQDIIIEGNTPAQVSPDSLTLDIMTITRIKPDTSTS